LSLLLQTLCINTKKWRGNCTVWSEDIMASEIKLNP
jgi:hypothetical protein